MKRILVASMLLVTFGAAAVSAQQTTYSQGGMDQGSGMESGTMQGGGMGGNMGGGMMGGGMGGGMMGGGMGGGMMGGGYMEHGHGRGPCMGCMVACASMIMPHVVATSDGGVVVAIGGRLIKYDANLRRVADTPIYVDWTQVQRRVQQIMENCPMNRRMMMMRRGMMQRPSQGQSGGQTGQFQGQ